MQRQFCSRDRRKEKRSRGRVSGTRGRRWSTFLPWILVLTPRLRNRCKLAPRIQRWHLDCIQVMLSLRGSAVPGSCRLFTEKWKTRSSRGQSLGKIPAFKVRVAHSLFSCYLLSLGYFFEKDIYTQREKTLNDINHYKVRHMFWYEGEGSASQPPPGFTMRYVSFVFFLFCLESLFSEAPSQLKSAC